MSGHSKWSTIKHKKAALDAKRGKIFTKIGRMIMVAAKQSVPSGSKVSAKELYENPTSSLEVAISKAKEVNMPKDNVIRAIERGIGGGEGTSLVEATYEGYGPAGVAYVVKALTDNKNRTVAEIRKIFEQYGGRMGDSGSASYIFSNGPDAPQFRVPVTDAADIKKVLALAESLEDHDDVSEVWANYDIPDEVLAAP